MYKINVSVFLEKEYENVLEQLTCIMHVHMYLVYLFRRGGGNQPIKHTRTFSTGLAKQLYGTLSRPNNRVARTIISVRGG